jgi:lipopolysaccharide biosynthesis protein
VTQHTVKVQLETEAAVDIRQQEGKQVAQHKTGLQDMVVVVVEGSRQLLVESMQAEKGTPVDKSVQLVGRGLVVGMSHNSHLVARYKAQMEEHKENYSVRNQYGVVLSE